MCPLILPLNVPTNGFLKPPVVVPPGVLPGVPPLCAPKVSPLIVWSFYNGIISKKIVGTLLGTLQTPTPLPSLVSNPPLHLLLATAVAVLVALCCEVGLQSGCMTQNFGSRIRIALYIESGS